MALFMTDSEGTATIASSTSEQTVFELTPDDFFWISSVNLDVSALTQNSTFRLYTKVDQTTYRLRFGTGTPIGGTIAWTTGSGQWLQFVLSTVYNQPIKVTFQSTNPLFLEGANRDIPYQIGFLRG